MAYLGNSPARSFISFERQVFTIVNSQTAYTLDHSVTNENDIRLVVNNVVQEPGSGKAYTASGTTLTLSAALTNGTDEMYCVYLGRATATEAPGAGSVGTSQLASEAVTNAKVASSIITGQTAETSIATDDLILLSDTSASGALKKMTRANFVSGIGGTNTPAFSTSITSNQNISNNSETKVAFATEQYDTASAFDASTNYRFTVPSDQAGKYFFTTFIIAQAEGTVLSNAYVRFKINGNYKQTPFYYSGGSTNMFNSVKYLPMHLSCCYNLSASDYVEVFVYLAKDSGSGTHVVFGTEQYSHFSGYKLIE